jgi:3-deoxy-manno-octulosonate cytidylyltransferase (CMP-KDO synthetase)
MIALKWDWTNRLPSLGRHGLQLKNPVAPSPGMLRTAIIVPCRLESKRFPRKLLHEIKGQPLVAWVAERIRRSAPTLDLWFAVDDGLLRDCLESRGFRTILTRVDHASGTDRIAEANRTIGADRVINIQADEPMVSAQHIALLAQLIEGPADMATLATRFASAEDFRNPNQVKVLCDRMGRALLFTRAPVPYARDLRGEVDDAWLARQPCYRHLGLYAYKAGLLEAFSQLPTGALEHVERLEQLRVLENGREIAVGITDDPTIGVDTPEDARKFEAYLARAPR